MSYTLCTAHSGAIYGTTPTNIFPVNCSNLTQSQYLNAPAGTYTNTAINVTISWTGGSVVATLPIGSVTATVIPSCTAGSSGTLNFPPIDPSSTADVAVSYSGLTNICTNGMSFSITGLSSSGGGTGTCTSFTGTMKSTSTPADTLNYTAACSTGSYTGTGGISGVSIPISGKIVSTQYQNAKGHNDYSDTLTVTVSY